MSHRRLNEGIPGINILTNYANPNKPFAYIQPATPPNAQQNQKREKEEEIEREREMSEVVEIASIPVTPRSRIETPPISEPTSLLHSPTLSRLPLLLPDPNENQNRERSGERGRKMGEMLEIASIPVTPRSRIETPPMSAPHSLLHSPTLTRSPLLLPNQNQNQNRGRSGERERKMGEAMEVASIPVTPRSRMETPPISAPPSLFHSPTLTRSPLLQPNQNPNRTPKTPRTPGSRFMTPFASPMRKAIVNMRSYLEDVGHLTKLDPQDAWLPITESRSGNAYYSAFHTLTSGIGIQALVLPVAFTFLGWTWGIICLSLAFIWQLYTLWMLTQLHESVPGTRYSRYLHLSKAAFGNKLGKWLALFPTMYLSAGTCMALIIIGGSTMKLFFETVCGPTCDSKPLTAIEWYLVFVCLAVVLAQLPNLNSIAGISLIGAITAVSYCTIIWVLSVSKSQLPGVSYEPLKAKSNVATILSTLNALGIIAFAFRGHNLVLEIQSTMPSSLKHPAHVPMWRGVKIAYLLIAMCLFPIAIGGFWAYGNLIPAGGILTALFAFHGRDTARGILGLTSLLVVLNCLSSFQIYAMPVFDNLEAAYTGRKNKPCPWWLRSSFRAFFGSVAFFIAVAFPFLSSLAGLIGGIALPVTFAYPCFMWNLIKKPERYSAIWYINWGLGFLGMLLSVLLIVGGIWSTIDTGLKLRFFKP